MISEREQQKPTRHSDNYVAKVFVGSQPLSAHQTAKNHTHNTSIIFFGTDNFSLIPLQGLIDAGYKIAAVVTKPDSKSGRGQHLTASVVKHLAVKHNIPVWQPKSLKEIEQDIQKLAPVTGILASYGKIIPESTIQLFTPGIINIHPSLLPKYRGPSPIESAILNRDKFTGVSIMQLSSEMDAGPIYNQITEPLQGTETATTLYQTLAEAGTAQLLSILPSIIEESLKPIPQDETIATYCKLLDKKDAWIDFENTDSADVEAKIRAQIDFPKSKVNIFGKDIVITKAHIEPEQKTRLDILCRDGLYISIDELITPNGRKVSKKDFLNGYSKD